MRGGGYVILASPVSVEGMEQRESIVLGDCHHTHNKLFRKMFYQVTSSVHQIIRCCWTSDKDDEMFVLSARPDWLIASVTRVWHWFRPCYIANTHKHE